MSQDNTPGEIRPQSVPSLEILSNTLATVDSVAALLEHALQHPATITPVWSRGLAAQFRNLADQMESAWHVVTIGVSDQAGITIGRSFEVLAIADPKQCDLEDMCSRDPATAAIAARFVLSDWRGVFGPDGNALDFSIASIESLFLAFPGLGARIAGVIKEGRIND